MRFFSFTFLACLCVAFRLPAQPDPGTNAATATLSLEDCIELALQHNLDVQIERINPAIARFTVGLSYADWEPSITTSFEHDYNRSPGGVDAQGRPFGGTESDTDRISAGLNGRLPWGLSYNLGGNIADQTGTRPSVFIDRSVPNGTFSTNLFFDPILGQTVTLVSTNYATFNARSPFETTSGRVGLLTLQQPLLKNFWIDSTRLNIQVNKNRLKVSELGLQLQVMRTINAVVQAYYELIFARENIKVEEKALELAERLVGDNRRRVEVGTLAPLDERQSESQVAASRADLLAARNIYSAQQNALKALLTDTYTKWHAREIIPSETLTAPPTVLDVQESWASGMTRRPDLLQSRLEVERLNIVLRYDHNQLFPQLDLVGSYGYNGTGKEFSDALGDVRERNNPFYSIGAVLTVPLGNGFARNNYKITKEQKKQALLQLKKLEEGILIQIDDSVAQVRNTFERVDATREARRYAEEALGAEQKKLDNGKSTSFMILQFQRDLTTARQAEIRALSNYRKALSDLYFNEGTTLQRHKISVDFK